MSLEAAWNSSSGAAWFSTWEMSSSYYISISFVGRRLSRSRMVNPISSAALFWCYKLWKPKKSEILLIHCRFSPQCHCDFLFNYWELEITWHWTNLWESIITLEMSLNHFHKHNLRHLPRFPDFFVTFGILSPSSGNLVFLFLFLAPEDVESQKTKRSSQTIPRDMRLKTKEFGNLSTACCLWVCLHLQELIGSPRDSRAHLSHPLLLLLNQYRLGHHQTEEL